MGKRVKIRKLLAKSTRWERTIWIEIAVPSEYATMTDIAKLNKMRIPLAKSLLNKLSKERKIEDLKIGKRYYYRLSKTLEDNNDD